MLIGRTHEYDYFNDFMAKEGSQMVVFYGQRFLGKTTFILDFVKDKNFAYIASKSANEDLLLKDLNEAVENIGKMDADAKKVLIIDEFQQYAKVESFMPILSDVLTSHHVLIVLISSHVNWVETSMVKTFKKAVTMISAFYKCRELSFVDIHHIYPEYAKANLFILYGIFGGVAGLWNFFDPTKDVRTNIIEQVLSDKSYLRNVGYQYCIDGLRESSVYDTILLAIANDNNKLNDLYKTTGFSRAKISVYLKALMEQKQIEKVYSIDCPLIDNSQRAIYRIANHFTSFYFTFIFDHESELAVLGPEKFFDQFIQDKLAFYCGKYLKELVKEYMIATHQMAQPTKTEPDCFVGKERNIDLAWKVGESYHLALCAKLKVMRTYDDLEYLVEAAKEAGMENCHYYLVSYKAFDEKLTLESKMKDNVHLLQFSEILDTLQ